MTKEEISKQLDEMSLNDLSEVVRCSLSRMYNKLREEEGFGYYQNVIVTSIGSEEYDVEVIIVDHDSHSSGVEWQRGWRF